MGDREVQMDLGHVADVRYHRQSMREREIGDLQPFGDAGEAGDVGLDEVHGPGVDEIPEVVEAVELLAEGDGGPDLLGEPLVPLNVVVPQRLLEPIDE
jgi:hypothetical protein